MNKINYFLVPVAIILIISNLLFYSKIGNLNKQISEIEKELTSQKENTENLQNLLVSSWKKYQNTELGFSFKYPELLNVCNETEIYKNTENSILTLGLRISETCIEAEKNKDVAPIRITIKENDKKYKTAEEAFYEEFLGINKNINSDLKYFKIKDIDAYGGGIINKADWEEPKTPDQYGLLILKNNKILKINVYNYQNIKLISNTLISSLTF